ncbi:MAG: aminotransferase class I/II-fold pyridoxal phosphate-dependent enzyme [Proteobacteria bacterium]|nr:aminotransferase class I/II-fold pyridoxal phosphate-dependent enzyme [Pseudomonadota bacterium]HQR04916.1 methionine aminotransferase [Rhodocyclaceae bacterium]
MPRPPTLPSRLPRVGTTIFTIMSRLAAEHGAINLSQGFPDFAPPQLLLEQLHHHLAQDCHQYAPLAGVPALREAIAAKVAALYGRQYDAETEVTITAGGTQALTTAIMACVRPGDEVVVFAPVYDSYIPAIELNGGVVRVATLRAPHYRPDWNEVRALLSPRTRLILLNTPHNPTGSIWSAADMEALAALVRGTDILLLADEVYEHMVYDGARHESLALYPDLAARAFIVSSFGKTYHITGWKIAYCLAPAPLMAEFRKAHQFNVFCVFHPAQRALADFMVADPGFALGLAAFYQARRDFFRTALSGSRLALLPCAGSYFQLADYSALSDEPDTEFARRLTIEHGVAAIPLSAFHPEGTGQRIVRFCFAKHEDTLSRAAERLCRL